MVNQNRTNNFNIIRFIAAMMVVLGHMSHLIGVEVNTFMGQAVSTIGVKIFFLISGYLIANSFKNDSNILRYAIRRVFRIIPGLVGVVCFSIFIIGPICTTLPIREYFLNSTTWRYLKNIVLYIQYFLPGVFVANPYPNAINGSLWTLPVEVFMYILVPVIFLVFRKCEKWKVALILAILSEGFTVFCGYFKPKAYYVIYGTDIFSAFTIIPYFFVGMFFTNEKLKKYLNLQLAVGLLCIGSMIGMSQSKTELLIFIILPYFVFSFSFVENPKFYKCFATNDFSYGVYLYGFVLQQFIVEKLMKYQISLNMYFVICGIVSVVFGMISWYLIEKPAQKFAKKLLKNPKISAMKQLNVD